MSEVETLTATQPAPVSPVQPAANVDAEVARRDAHIAKIEAENFKYRERIRALEPPPPVTDPAQKAAAEAQRVAAIEKATLRALIGQPVPSAEVADLIAIAATRSPGVTVADDGTVNGISDVVNKYVAPFLYSAAHPATPPPATPLIARQPAAAEPMDPRFTGVGLMSDLLKLGPEAVLEFQTKHPAQFAVLQSKRR